MRPPTPILFAALALAACATDRLPQRFEGVWGLTPPACLNEDGVTRLRISGGNLQYYEWGGNVVTARRMGDGSTRLALEWWSVDDTDPNGEPIPRSLPGGLTLSPDGSQLRVDINGDIATYVRCP
jgi:hypothetical protein